MTQDVYVPSAGRGGLGSSSQAPTWDEDDDDDDVDQRHEELGPSQLQDAPSTQPIQPPGTRRRRQPDPYTPGTSAFSHKGKGKTRRQWGFVVDVSMYYYEFCSYFYITIWDCMDIVDYLDYARHVMLIVMFDVIVLCSWDD